MTPFLTRAFTISQYGAIDLIYTTVSVIALFANLNFDAALLRFYYGEGEENRKEKVISSAFIFSAVSSFIFCFISFVLFIFLKGLIFKTAEELYALFIALFSMPFIVFFTNELILLRMQRKAFIFVLVSVSNLILIFIFTMLFIKYFHWGLKSFFIAMLISYGIMSLSTLIYLKENFSFSFLSAELGRKMLFFGFPLLIPALVGTFLGTLNKYILQFYHNFATVATFAIGLRISMVVALITIPFRNAWLPHVFSAIDKDDITVKKKYEFVFRAFIILLFLIITCTSLFARKIILIISNKEYLSVLSVIGYVLLGAIFISLSGSFFNLGIYKANKTIYSLVAYTIGFLVNIILAVILIPTHSIAGAGISMLCGHFVTAMLLFYFSNRLYKINYDLRLLFSLSLVYLIFSILWNNGGICLNAIR